MKVGPKALALIEHFEGLRTKAYRCSAGVATIGIGSTRYADGRAVRMGDTITRDDAMDLFAETVDRDYAPGVQKVIGNAATTPAQFGAMVALAYNIGVGAFGRSSVARAHKAGDHAGAAKAFALWNKAGGRVLPGLTRRRAAEAALYRGDFDELARLTA